MFEDESNHINRNGAACVVERRPAVEDLAESRLRNHSYRALRRVSCEYRDGLLVLRGWLPTYYLKQVAQEVAGRVEGVSRIANQIQVGARATAR